MIAGMDSYPDDFPQAYRNLIKRLRSEDKPIALLCFPSLMKKAVENGDYPQPFGTAHTVKGDLQGLSAQFFGTAKSATRPCTM